MLGVCRFEDLSVEVSITPPSSLFSLTVINTATKNNLKRKEFISAYAFYGPSLREAKAELQTEAVTECCLLACSPQLPQLGFCCCCCCFFTITQALLCHSLVKKMLHRPTCR